MSSKPPLELPTRRACCPESRLRAIGRTTHPTSAREVRRGPGSVENEIDDDCGVIRSWHRLHSGGRHVGAGPENMIDAE